MSHDAYLIVGGGMTADAAVRGIREVDPDGSIGLIGREADPPYDRPPLTKGLWKGKPLESIWRKTQAAGADLHTGRTVQALDVEQKRVTDDQGVDYTYEKLLLATGGTPRRLPFSDKAILYYRTVADYRRLREMADRGRRFAVIGGGFIGSEIAAALAMNGKEVVMLFPEEGIGSRMFPAICRGSSTLSTGRRGWRCCRRRRRWGLRRGGRNGSWGSKMPKGRARSWSTGLWPGSVSSPTPGWRRAPA